MAPRDDDDDDEALRGLALEMMLHSASVSALASVFVCVFECVKKRE